MSDDTKALGAVAVLVAVLAAAAYARVVGGAQQAVIHRTGATALGILGAALSIFSITVAAGMNTFAADANLIEHPERVLPAIVCIAMTGLAVAGWGALCGIIGKRTADGVMACLAMLGIAYGALRGFELQRDRLYAAEAKERLLCQSLADEEKWRARFPPSPANPHDSDAMAAWVAECAKSQAGAKK
jgi:hypothetical protein